MYILANSLLLFLLLLLLLLFINFVKVLPKLFKLPQHVLSLRRLAATPDFGLLLVSQNLLRFYQSCDFHMKYR